MPKIFGAELHTLRLIPESGTSEMELSRKLGVHITTITKRMNILELKGMVCNQRSHNKTLNGITLTKQGRRFLDALDRK